MWRVLDLYDNPPKDGRVICVDDFGPLNLMPRKGKAWRPEGRPVRQRATYTRTQGVRHMLAALGFGHRPHHLPDSDLTSHGRRRRDEPPRSRMLPGRSSRRRSRTFNSSLSSPRAAEPLTRL
jgi:hypothetical protein